MSVVAILIAGPAQPLDLECLMRGGKSLPGRFSHDQVADVLVVEFRHRATTSADQELRTVRIIRIGTTDESIQRIQAMYQVGLYKKFQCAVDGWRSRTLPALVQAFEHVIRADRLVTVPDQFEYFAPLRRKSQASLAAYSFRILQRTRHAVVMVVFCARQLPDWNCFVHLCIRTPLKRRLYRAIGPGTGASRLVATQYSVQ